MQNVNTQKSGLSAAIRKLHQAPMSDVVAEEAANNLLCFMELLIEIDSQHKLVASKNGAPACV